MARRERYCHSAAERVRDKYRAVYPDIVKPPRNAVGIVVHGPDVAERSFAESVQVGRIAVKVVQSQRKRVERTAVPSPSVQKYQRRTAAALAENVVDDVSLPSSQTYYIDILFY